MIEERRVLRVRPRRIAATAPPWTDDQLAEREARGSLPVEVDTMAQRWAHWCDTRRYFGPPGRLPSVIGKLRTRTAAATDGGGGPDAFCSRDVAVFNMAVQAQEMTKMRVVFEAHYLYRPKPIKAAASALGINPRHWYTLRNGFALRAWSAHRALLGEQEKLWPMQATKYP